MMVNWTDIAFGAGTVVAGIGAWVARGRREASKACPQNGGRMDQRVTTNEKSVATIWREIDDLKKRTSRQSKDLAINQSQLAMLEVRHEQMAKKVYDKMDQVGKDVTEAVGNLSERYLSERYHDLDKRQGISEEKIEELRKGR